MSANNDKNKKKAQIALKSLDPSKYVREATVLPDITVDEFPMETAYVKNIELLFPEWTIVGEPWHEGWTDTDGINIYPKDYEISGEKSIKALYGLEESALNEKKKKPAAAKRGSLPLSSPTSADIDKPIPKVFTSIDGSDYDSYHWNLDFSSDTVDGDMKAVLNIAKRFIPALAAEQSDGNPEYLWKAIYPKLQSSDSHVEHSYNHSGRYCVRLFFAGKWRKVYVNDTIPIREDGSWGLVRSNDPLELWPTILSKAVHSAYYHSKYANFNNEAHGSQSRSSFVIFSLYALTGWLPNLPISIPEAISLDRARFQGLIQEMLFGGVLSIGQSNIPGPKPTEDYNESESTANPMKTKKAFKQEYDSRQEMYLKTKSTRDDRESKIESIEGHLSLPHDEVFVINYSVFDEASTTFQHYTFPILGVSLPHNTDICASSFDINSVEFLVDWRIQRPTAYTKFSENSLNDEEMIRIHFPELQPMTDLTMKLITVAELVEKKAVIFSLETLRRVPLYGQIGWHWNPVSKANDKKNGKDKTNVRPVEAVHPDNVCSNPGNMPFVVLALDTGTFFNSSVDEVGENTMKAKSSHLSICVSIHGDSTSSLPADIEEVQSPGARKTSINKSVIGASLKWSLLDDIVVVLQEIRHDDEEPLVMRLELPATSIIPITRSTFHIPADRLPHPSSSNDGKFIFWVRFLSKSSTYLTFHSSVNVKIGEAAEIYQRLNTTSVSYGHILTKEGMLTTSTRATMEKLLFRMPLALNGTSSVAEDHNSEEDTSNRIDNTRITAFLHVSNPMIARFVSLVVLYPNSSSESFTLPRLNGDTFILPSTLHSCILLARVHSEINIPSFKWNLTIVSSKPLIELNPLPKVPKALSQVSNASRSSISKTGLSSPAGIVSSGSYADNKLFSGIYSPNNKLCLFRDIYSMDQARFPFAFKISLSKPSNILDNDYHIYENIAITVNLYRKQDRQLIESYNGLSIIQAYSVDCVPYQSKDVDAVPSQISSHSAGSKSSLPEIVDIIIECLIDEHQMIVPSDWRATNPYIYQNIANNCNAMFAWRMEILSGDVAMVAHDCYDLERYNAIKNSWEEQNPGRSEQAKAMLEAYKIRKALRANPPVSSTLSIPTISLSKGRSASVQSTTTSKGRTSILKDLTSSTLEPSYENYYDLLALALNMDKSLVQRRYNIIENLPEYKEQIMDTDDGLRRLLTQEELDEEKSRREQEVKFKEESYRDLMEKFTKYNQILQQDTITRIEEIVHAAHSTNASILPLWRDREAYRIDVEAKNKALIALIEKGKDAVKQEIDRELGSKNDGKKGNKAVKAK